MPPPGRGGAVRPPEPTPNGLLPTRGGRGAPGTPPVGRGAVCSGAAAAAAAGRNSGDGRGGRSRRARGRRPAGPEHRSAGAAVGAAAAAAGRGRPAGAASRGGPGAAREQVPTACAVAVGAVPRGPGRPEPVRPRRVPLRPGGQPVGWSVCGGGRWRRCRGERLAQLAHDRGLDGRGRGLHEFAELQELRHHIFAGTAELFCERVIPGPYLPLVSLKRWPGGGWHAGPSWR